MLPNNITLWNSKNVHAVTAGVRQCLCALPTQEHFKLLFLAAHAVPDAVYLDTGKFLMPILEGGGLQEIP
jgi:hypothetical protein